jgi:phosphatidate cytidylyltransferase
MRSLKTPSAFAVGGRSLGSTSGSQLPKRLLTALVALPPMTWVLWHGGWPAALLFSAASLLAAVEFIRLALGGVRARDAGTLVSAALLPSLPFAAPASATAIALALVALSSFIAWSFHVANEDVANAPAGSALSVQALVFCALGLFFLSSLRALPEGRAWVLATVAATFGNDAAALAGGTLLGRHRMAPLVSPGKSWEGFAAGALGSCVAAALALWLWPDVLRVRDAVALALLCSTLGPVGDLSKSLLKRARGVKDAGRLLPGHGGMLDRIDALVVNSTAVWAWVSATH